MKQLGLLVRLIIGIIAGMLIGLCGGWFGIADTTGFVAVIRLLATFTSLFSTFLSFMIPLIIIAFITVGMAELGQKANRLFGLTLLLAYGTTTISGFLTFFIGKAFLPSLIKPITGAVLESNAFEPFFTIEVTPIFGVMTALVLAFVAYSCIAFGFTRRLARRVTRLSEAVSAAGALNQTIPVTGTDELARLAQNVNTMRDTIVERTRNEQTALQANSDLITAMSHDIRNPLTSLIGYLDLLEMQQAQLPEDLRRYVLASRDKAYQLKDLTGEMFRYFLVFSRGEQETHPEPYDAQILCAQLLGECAEELRSRGFDVNLLLLGTPCTVTTDAQMLKRVTDNLLSNIEKYADPAARLTILAEREGERLHVCFANRARRELARVESNHIGLRTCAAILKLLGGEFVTHRDGDDFTAEFTLPVTPPDAAQSET